MLNYLIRRLILLPITLFCIVLVNFVIINLAPGDPVTITEISQQGMAGRQADKSMAFGSDERYLQFREFYGLTLPIIFNLWPSTSPEEVQDTLRRLTYDRSKMDLKKYDEMRINFGDRSRFIMPILLSIVEDAKAEPPMRRMASRFFVRGGTRQAVLGPDTTPEEKEYNKKVANDNDYLRSLLISEEDTPEKIQEKIEKMKIWYQQNDKVYDFQPTGWQKVRIFFLDTRFARYMSRVLTLNFGTMRNDSNKTVVSEVTKRFKYSLTLSILPLMITFVLCQIFGFIMAISRHSWNDLALNLIFLILYAIPIFVVAPFLIENVAIHHKFPFTDTPIPISGFTSSDTVYNHMTSSQRFWDVIAHIALPIAAIMYGSLAAQTRLSRTAVLEVMHQDYVRTARAKGLSPFAVYFRHVGRNAAITIITSVAGSLGIVLGGSLIVETLFEINGFGKFFYDAIINRDYNVIMFSTIAGAFLTLLGYLAADIAYTVMDPRVTLE